MPRPRRVLPATGTLPRATQRLSAGSTPEPYAGKHAARIGFTGTPETPPATPEPRRVPLGFVPGQTTNQIAIAR